MNETQRKALHCMYSGMAKGTSWAEATSNLAIVGLRKFEVSQSVSQARQPVSQAGS